MIKTMPGEPGDPSPTGAESLWTARSFAFVTLWSGRKSQRRVLEWLATAEVPPHSVLYWVDNSDGRSTAALREAWAGRLSPRFRKLVRIEAGEPCQAPPRVDLLHPGRHRHMVQLYNRVFPQVWEEMVVTLEDDVVPPLDGVRSLVALLAAPGRVALAVGVYRSRINPARISAARDKRYWQDIPAYDGLPAEPFEVGMTGGGFALISNRMLQQALPVRCTGAAPGPMLGWDANLGRDLTALGYRIMAHPGVRCAHLCPEVLAYEAAEGRAPQ